MKRGGPSMMALLGLLAVAGYQNRDKLGELLGNASRQGGLGGQGGPDALGRDTTQSGGLGGLGGMLGGILGGGAAGGGLASVLSGGLGDLVDSFTQAGRGNKAQSWVGAGANETCDTSDLEETLGEDTINALTQQTGLSRSELLQRLCQTLPDAVNQLTPGGHVPDEAEASRIIS